MDQQSQTGAGGGVPPQPPMPPGGAIPSSPSQIPQQYQMNMQQQGGFLPRGYPPNQPRPPQMMYAPMGPQPGGFLPAGMPYAPPVYLQGYPPRMAVGMPQYNMMFPRGPVASQQYIPPPQGQSPLPPQQIPVASQASGTPYVKRERKPLDIINPKTLTALEIKTHLPPPKQASASPSPALGPVPVPVMEQGLQTPSQKPTAAEEMRLKALAAKTGASPAPAIAQVQMKMEALRLDQAEGRPEPAPQPPQTYVAPVAPKAQAPAPVNIVPTAPVKIETSNVHNNVPTPATVSVPAASETVAAVSQASAEERKAKAKKEYEEKMQKMQEYEQKVREEEARKEEEARREEEAVRAKESSPPALNTAVDSPQISLPLPTAVVPASSPTNRSGDRLVYSRDDLLFYRNVDVSMQRPADLHPDFQDYQPRPKQVRVPPARRENQPGGPPRVGPAGGPPQVSDWRGPKGGSQGGSGQQNNAGPVVAPLKVSQNAWKRTQPTSEHEATLRTIRSILNRLAKDNFDVLSKEVLAIPMTSLTMLEDVIRSIFDKALLEPTFGPVYAQLCKEISDKSGGEWDFVRAFQRDNAWFWSSTTDITQEGSLNGPDPNNPAVGYASEQEAMEAAKKQTGFKRILLNTCQQEFEKNSFEDVNAEEKKIKETMDVTLEDTKQKLQQLEAQRRKIKKRVLGNMSFIGELYLKKMLSAKIINTCIVQLLGEETVTNPESFFDSDKKNEVPQEDIECICKLFQTIGKDMDQGEYVKVVDRHFNFLTMLEQHLAKSERPELRTSRQRFLIKDLLDLRKARWVDKRETIKAPSRDDVRQKSTEQESSRGAAGGRGGYGGNSGPTNAGRGSQAPSARFQQVTTTSIRAAQPAPASSRFSQAATTSRDAPVQKSGAVIPARSGLSAATTTRPPPSVATPSPSASPAPAVTAKKANGTADSISEDKLKTSYASALEEFVVNSNAADLANEFKTLFERFAEPSKARQILVSLMVDRIIEKKEEERQALLKLMPMLVKDHSVLSSKDVVDALKNSLEFLNDIMIDSPKAGQHIAILLSKCVESGALTVEQVAESSELLKQESPEGLQQLGDELKKVLSADNATKLSQLIGGGEDSQ